jgi:hypothetical protein
MPVASERVKELESLCEKLLSTSTATRTAAEEAYLQWKVTLLMKGLFINFTP